MLLYLHGGGYQLGSFKSHGELASRLGRASGRRVLLPEYRLAPEHPFPAAIDDVLAVWRWLRGAAGLDASAITVAGDSAGGALAVAMMTTLRDSGEDLPAAAVLMSPWADLSSSGASITERVDEDPILTPHEVPAFAATYLAGADPRTPLASPLFALLDGLPPLLIQVGTAELLLSDSEELAKSAAAAGVDVTLQVREEEAEKAGGIQTSDMPLNRMVDAVLPESEVARRFSQDVDQFVGSNFQDIIAKTDIRILLLAWRDNDNELRPLL